MATLIRLTSAATGDSILVNADAVTCILPAGSGGAVVYFVSADDDKLTVKETLDQIEGALGAVHA
jgi:hypothetical protein